MKMLKLTKLNLLQTFQVIVLVSGSYSKCCDTNSPLDVTYFDRDIAREFQKNWLRDAVVIDKPGQRI